MVRPVQRLWHRQHRLVRQGLLYSLLLVLCIFVLGGIGFWWLDPTVASLGDGLWLSFTTAATVGYGDMVPSTHVSRAFAVVVVLLGLAVLSLVTASLAALFVQQDVVQDERQIEADLLRELHHLRQELRDLRAQFEQTRLSSGDVPHPSDPPVTPCFPETRQDRSSV